MNIFEKIYCLFAAAFAVALLILFMLWPELRRIDTLIPVALAGLTVNVGFMFIVLRDIFLRNFPHPNDKYFWIGMVLLIWPATLYYLLRHGLRSRQ